MNSAPYLQGYQDCKDGLPYNPRFIFKHKGITYMYSTDLLLPSEIGEYTLGWDDAYLSRKEAH